MTATELKAGSNLEKILAAGTFAVTGECGPPKSADGNVIAEKAKLLKGFVDAVNITDNQTAVVRICSMASGYLAQQNGIEAIMQMTCRDRNRLAMQADILGAVGAGHQEHPLPHRRPHELRQPPAGQGRARHRLRPAHPHVQGHARREEVPVRRRDGRSSRGCSSAAPRTRSATRSSSARCA